MLDNDFATGDRQIDTRKLLNTDCSSEASKHCLDDVMSGLTTAARPGDQTGSQRNNEVTDLKLNTPEPVRKDSALYNDNAPISHFDQVANGVYRSGRPNGAEGVKEAVEKVWGDQQLDPAHAEKTSIIDLRAPSDQKTTDEINNEIANSKELGVRHASFALGGGDSQVPAETVQAVLNYIDQQKADGQRVLIHCHHGTDRTGLISAAYELTHDAQLQQLVKDNPAQAFKTGLKSMTDNGFDTGLYPNMTQNLQKFVSWKQAQQAEQSNTDDTSNTTAATYLEIPSIW